VNLAHYRAGFLAWHIFQCLLITNRAD